MSYSQLSCLHKVLNESQFNCFTDCLSKLSPSSKIISTAISLQTGIETSLINQVLRLLYFENILKCNFAIRCPQCGLLLQEIDDISDIPSDINCYNCEDDFELSTEDVEVFYTFNEYPFINGQQKELSLLDKLSDSVVREEDSLAYLLKNGRLDFNKCFFNPCDKELNELQESFEKIFENKKTTKEKGDTLETLVIKMFSLCKHFRASSIRTDTNQIDCYVRNVLYIPGISDANCKDSFMIECKNEAKTPEGSYLSKLHSILKNTGKQFGIIISKQKAPKTYKELSNKIFLKDEIIIISLYKEDLRKIVYGEVNLLEVLSKKIDEVKLCATHDLSELGLYD